MMIDVSTSADAVRINPVGRSRVAAPPQAMGIVRLRGRDGVRCSTNARERAGPRRWSEAIGVGHAREVVPTSLVDIVDKERARHSTAERPRVRRDPSAADETQAAS